MSNLRDIAWSRYAAKRHPEAQEKSASHEHAMVDRRCLNACADDNDDCSCKHAGSATEQVIDRTSQEDSRDGTYVVDSEDNSSR